MADSSPSQRGVPIAQGGVAYGAEWESSSLRELVSTKSVMSLLAANMDLDENRSVSRGAYDAGQALEGPGGGAAP